MNAFHEHHKDSIRFGYRCFDRLLRNARIQPFQQPERVIGFFNTYREGNRVTRSLLTDVADQFRDWVTNRAHKWGVPILDAPEGRRDDFLDRYFKRVKANEVVAILKAREPARILIANGNKKDDRWYLQITNAGSTTSTMRVGGVCSCACAHIFPSRRQLMGYSGLVSSEYSSGNRIQRGSITKTGNAHLRRVIIESA